MVSAGAASRRYACGTPRGSGTHAGTARAAPVCARGDRSYDRQMGSGLACVSRSVAAAWLLAVGCATHAGAPTATVRNPSTTEQASAACAPQSRRARFREMTWAEYYADVRERAFRNNATVIWITPPSVTKPRVPQDSDATACARKP